MKASIASKAVPPARLDRAPVEGRAAMASEAAGRAVLPWALALAGLLVWCYWPVIKSLWSDWQHDQNYSVGQLVPPAALYLMWHNRARLARVQLRPCWWGIGLILAAQAAWAYGLIFMFESVERYSLVLTVAGLVLLAGGCRLFWELKWILLFLPLMIPLPGRVHNLISDPLQGLSTQGAEMALELIGITTLREGHVLVLNGNVSVAVAEACSGLRMLTAFVVVAYVFAGLVRCPRWQKIVLVASSIPVAMICNLIRLVVTAVLFLAISSETAETFFHDFAGLTMMPMAILALLGELWIMSRLVTNDEAAKT